MPLNRPLPGLHQKSCVYRSRSEHMKKLNAIHPSISHYTNDFFNPPSMFVYNPRFPSQFSDLRPYHINNSYYQPHPQQQNQHQLTRSPKSQLQHVRPPHPLFQLHSPDHRDAKIQHQALPGHRCLQREYYPLPSHPHPRLSRRETQEVSQEIPPGWSTTKW
jgi:hypothetical protein